MKLKKKNLDIIIANNISAIDSEKSTVYIKTLETEWQKIENVAKYRIAKKIVKMIETIYR